MDMGYFCRSEYPESMIHPIQYETSYHGNRYMSPTTPTKRKHCNINEEEREVSLDSGYFSHNSSVSHSHACEGPVCPDSVRDSECMEGRRPCSGCCRDDELYRSPRRHGQWSAYKYQSEETPMTLQSIHETTPVKNTTYPPRRCFTDTKGFGHVYRGEFQSSGRAQTCVKSRKRLQCQDRFSDCYQDSQQYRSTSRRNLHHELDIADSDWTTEQTSFTPAINNDGHSGHPCTTPLQPVRYHYNNCSRSPSRRIRPDISSPRNQTASTKPKCCCSDLQNGLLKLAESAFSNIRRKASSPESFVQFKTELDLTNKFLEQTLQVLKQIKDVCGH